MATGRPAIIAFRGGFHGRTAQTMALTSSRVTIRGDFEPLPGSVYHTPFPYCYRASGGPHDPAACTCDWEAQLELLFQQIIPPTRVAAIVVEPVLGEGGYVVPGAGFLRRLREITRQHGILLVADEVQTGFGRTGRMFAVEHWDVTPDILTMAKGIASGLPLSGLIARRELIDRWAPGAHGGTYGGNVVACAAANATLDVIRDEGLPANAAARGTQLLEGLRARRPPVVARSVTSAAWAAWSPSSSSSRVSPTAATPDPEMAKRVIAEALARHLIVLSAGSWGQVVRIIPPLVTTEAEVAHALSVLREALDAAGA